MNLVHAPLGSELLSLRDLEALAPVDRWAMEEKLDEAQGLLREFNDEELRRWVEVDGKTQTEIAKLVERNVSTVSRRCAKLDLRPPKGKGTAGGRPEVLQTQNPPDEPEELVEGEVILDEPPPPDGRYTQCPTCGHRLRKDQPLPRRKKS